MTPQTRKLTFYTLEFLAILTLVVCALWGA